MPLHNPNPLTRMPRLPPLPSPSIVFDDTALFYGTKGSRQPKYLLVGESWGKDEVLQRMPFVGWSGAHLHTLLAEADIDEDECLFTNVVPEQPMNNDMWRFFYPTKIAREQNKLFIRGLCPMDNVCEGLVRLRKLIAVTNPEFIIAIGNYALWALTDDSFNIDDDNYRKVPTGIMRYRGSQIYSSLVMRRIKLLPIIHPASMQAVWGNRYLIKHDLSMRLKQPWKEPDYEFTVKPTYEQVMFRLGELEKEATQRVFDHTTPLWLASDHETTTTKFIACTGLAWSRTEALCIPFVCEEDKQGYWTEDQEFKIVLSLRRLLTHPGITLIGQSYLYDAQYSALWWQIVRAPDLDTRIMQHLLWPGMSQDLNFISSLYRDHHKYWKDDLKELYTKEGQIIGWRYNCMDSVSTYECAEVIYKHIKAKGMLEQLDEEIEHLDMLLEMMIRGVKVDRLRRKEVAKELGTAIHAYGDRIEPLVPPDLYSRKSKASPWYRSPKQLMEIIYDVLGMKVIRHHKTKQPTVSDAALHTLKQREPLLIPIITPIQEYRSIKKFSEFTEAELDSDMRMRCEYSPTTDTFRLRSKKNVFGNGANLQNLPKGHEEDEYD